MTLAGLIAILVIGLPVAYMLNGMVGVVIRTLRTDQTPENHWRGEFTEEEDANAFPPFWYKKSQWVALKFFTLPVAAFVLIEIFADKVVLW